MKIELYHGTSVSSADEIMKHGFKDRVASGRSRWEKRIASKAGFVYLTTAYAFFFGMNAAKGKKASVIKVEVDTNDLYPDEDLFFFKFGNMFRVSESDMDGLKHLADDSLRTFGNVAVRPSSIRVIGRKDFDVREMIYFSDPSISPMNYKLMGAYYRDLTDKWFAGEDITGLNSSDYLVASMQKQS